ncbi:hypothetical protein PPL_10885 [Heterostelium album PN500]|uniref:Uncharacterized protein n=1 Tax=Heterostelium pallidum (strain ATCC 26659 / Pp 5 / PN500) TaxID=670386 RepID=D3BS93_HETP5|nr:hypothetical protein PPL_10885 [Heterostelium album PN500]EFA75830.1 hypothetical protein PPL_10885 [Heterostelium album PN500]|eukprot:XP_020427964.1 hypothetical protein PPL_10885 [Heterostelium album PN500]
MSYRRNTGGGTTTTQWTDDIDDLDANSNNVKGGFGTGTKYRDHNEGFFSKLPFLRSIPIPTAPFPRLLMSIVLDIVGIYTQLIPLFGFAMWPTISSYLIYRLYGSSFGVMLSFVEETVCIHQIPGLGFIPTATLCWLNEKYDLMLMTQKYLPWVKSLSSLRSIYYTVYKVVKYIFIATLTFIVYKMLSIFQGGTLFNSLLNSLFETIFKSSSNQQHQ